MDETERIRKSFNDRKYDKRVIRNNKYTKFSLYISREREKKYSEIIGQAFADPKPLKIIEIGAGSGSNLLFFNKLGIPEENIWANELLEERGEMLKENLPGSHIDIGNVLNLPYKEKFDIVFQSTVFSSVLQDAYKAKIALKMFDMVKAEGIILWYDFVYNNPVNKNVKGVKKEEIKRLFPAASDIKFYPVTLAPPIGRKVGDLYNFFNFIFPFFRTHVVGVIRK